MVTIAAAGIADEVRAQLTKDFEIRWFGRWFLPQNLVAYWFTNFNRSDIMKEVFDNNLFEHKTFGDMGSGLPRILINADDVDGREALCVQRGTIPRR